MLASLRCGKAGKLGRAMAGSLAAFLFVGLLGAQTPQTRAATSAAVQWPTADGVYTIANFKFGSGERLAQLRLHYLTLGTPHRDASGHVDNAVLLLHGTGGSASSLLAPQFSTVLFGPGQPLDITRFFLILPDDIGHGGSSKPSDGMHMRFPKYDYDDMVQSQRQMLMDGLHVDHLRLILGTSMGCMESFVWGETYPGIADALMPLACLPVQIAGRNRMMRYMAIQAIEDDPEWRGGDYTKEPIGGLRNAAELTFVMGSAPLYLQKIAPTRKAAEDYIENYLATRLPPMDANDTIYQ